MLITLIAAMSDDGIMGQRGKIPWRLPRDVAHFRAYCAGKWLLLGRRTFEEMEGWFRGHHPLVMTRQAEYTPVVGQRVASVQAASMAAESHGAAELVVLGGGEIFALALPLAQQLILTQVHTKMQEGTRFPDWNPADWLCAQQETFPADSQHAFAHTISFYHRKTNPTTIAS
jgi:dihydrofolate reductase